MSRYNKPLSKPKKEKDSSTEKYKYGRDESKNNIRDLPRGLRIDTTTGEGTTITRLKKQKVDQLDLQSLVDLKTLMQRLNLLMI